MAVSVCGDTLLTFIAFMKAIAAAAAVMEAANPTQVAVSRIPAAVSPTPAAAAVAANGRLLKFDTPI